MRSASAVSQKLAALRMGNAMRLAPIWAGRIEVAEAGLRGSRQDEEEHDGAMEGDESEVIFGQDSAVERERPVGPDKVDSHQQRQEGADGYGSKCEDEVLDSDDAVVGAKEKGSRDEGIGPRVLRGWLREFLTARSHWGDSFWCAPSQVANSFGETTRRVAFMR